MVLKDDKISSRQMLKRVEIIIPFQRSGGRFSKFQHFDLWFLFVEINANKAFILSCDQSVAGSFSLRYSRLFHNPQLQL